MKKNFYFLFIVLGVLIFPKFVYATDANGKVCDYSQNSSCSGFQDNSIRGEGIIYFSHRIYSECDGIRYKTPVYTNPEKKVTCSNGNTSPYTKLVKSGCPDKGTNCGSSKFCSVIVEYNCDLTSSGAKYKVTTGTRRPTSKTTKKTTTSTTTTTTTTTEAPKVNTKLKSLSLSNGSINFNPEIYAYNVKVESNVSNINVSAIPEDSNSRVSVTGNNNVKNGSQIKVVVLGSNNSVSTYIITIEKDDYIPSNNSKLKTLTIEGYTISFNPKVNEYKVTVSNDVNELKLNYQLDDEKGTVEVEGNSNLINGSKVIIKVTAEDGSENKYIINIEKKKKSNFIKVLFIIILIAAILAGAYYIYKKFVLSKKGEKYEYE